ncbi:MULTISPECIES: pseudouridine synthase [unclassified Leptolyngbya]|uniref:pseudouridine synthase n=1 Tax=unclassified Leptolyngbya TaxID=2650499 RepID=UPI0016895670|nr:pseudouridine synthase [Leptolyngbya sp. FACHB-8]MBD2154860.1 pseudouridine synthase [Leptolyngbya sp. FACHB-16]
MPYRYLVFYKPYDVLTQFSRPDMPSDEAAGASCRTLKDFIPVPDVYPVGRLDRDSEGLLLLTDDGKLQNQLLDPKYAHPRTYWVQVERVPDAAALDQLQQGVVIRGYRTRPAKVRLLCEEPELPAREPPIRFRKNVPTAWLEMTLTEGRNRQVRRMTAAVGFPTLRLVRVAIAHLRLTGLQPGEWRYLSPADVKLLQIDMVQNVKRRR